VIALIINRDNSPIPGRGWVSAVLTRVGITHNRYLMLCCLLPCLILLLWAGAIPALQPDIPKDPKAEILARVNSEPVTRADLQRLLSDPGAHWQLREELDAEAADDAGLYALALRKLIQRRLFLQQADRQNIKISGEELDQAIVALRSRFADLEDFGKWMRTRVLDEQTLFDSLRDDLRVRRVIAALVAGVKVSPQQVQDYYDSGGGDLQAGVEVRLRMIVVRSMEAAEEVLAALRAGEDFSRLARQHSLGQRAAQGGDTGWYDIRRLAQPLRVAVDSLQTGEASHPLQRNADEFLIVALQGRRPLPAGTLEEASPVIVQRLLTILRQEAISSWLRQQELLSTIEVFARQKAAESVAAASPEEG
jgi:peptidyl-prolyl cis-trans isomerase SurA